MYAIVRAYILTPGARALSLMNEYMYAYKYSQLDCSQNYYSCLMPYC